jgi:hypothetical protein
MHQGGPTLLNLFKLSSHIGELTLSTSGIHTYIQGWNSIVIPRVLHLSALFPGTFPTIQVLIDVHMTCRSVDEGFGSMAPAE